MGGRFKSAVSGGIGGATAGSTFGPWGTAIGGIAGAGLGALSGGKGGAAGGKKGAPAPPNYTGALSAPDLQALINANYNAQKSRLDPRFAQAQGNMEDALSNRGLGAGMKAYDAYAGNFGRERTDAYGRAMENAITLGHSQNMDYNRLYQQAMENQYKANVGAWSANQGIDYGIMGGLAKALPLIKTDLSQIFKIA